MNVMTLKSAFHRCQKLYDQNVKIIIRYQSSLIISCKRKELDFYGQKYDNNEEIPLASKGWHSHKSKGDYFVIRRTNESRENSSTTTFSDLGLDSKIIDVLRDRKIVDPTDIQRRSIPALLSGKNCLVTAETGCGKTLAYLAPILQQMLEWKSLKKEETMNSPLALILTPSRELAQQIAAVAEELCSPLMLNVKCLVGGRTKQKMLNPSMEPIDLLVASIGALSKLVTTGIYKVGLVHHVVLDEADTMLDDSFEEKVSYFLRKIAFQYQVTYPPTGSQLSLVSATMPKELPDTLAKFIDPGSIKRVSSDNLHKTIANVPQRFLRLGMSQKPIELLKLVKGSISKNQPVMVFSNKAEICDWISLFLNENGIKCTNLNGKMSNNIRVGKYDAYKNGEANVISCTDIASRGLDTLRTKHVINYNFPAHTCDYIHRCGRIGRIGSDANCYVTNLIGSEDEINMVQKVEMSVRKMIELPSVDGNITKVLKKRLENKVNREINVLKKEQEQLSRGNLKV